MTTDAATETVFVVDDDAGVLKALSRLLRAEGWRVETFESAEAFLARPDAEPPRVSRPRRELCRASTGWSSSAASPRPSPPFQSCS